MRIFYEGEAFAGQSAGGITRYFTNLINRLPPHYQPVLTSIYRRDRLNYPRHPRLHLQEYRRFRPGRLSHWLEKRSLQRFAARQSFDLTHPTYYTLLSGADLTTVTRPLVITVHDMIHELFPQVEPGGRTIAAKQQAVNLADAIVCVSHNTKHDLLRFFPHLEDRITVTHLASEIDASTAEGDDPVPSRPYFLYVGARTQEYKNFDGLLQAFAKAVSVNPDIILCVVGAPFTAAESQQIAELHVDDRLLHCGYVNDRHLAKLYRHSLGFVYPSRYEGFGIPPLEAMTCGTVAIAANTSSIPEVVGDAGILFDPAKIHDLADILLTVAQDSTLRSHFIAKGQHHIQQFSWDRTAAQTLAVYQSLLTSVQSAAS